MDDMKTCAENGFQTQLFAWIETMTKFSVADRQTASQLYTQIIAVSKVLDRGSIFLHRAAKRPREE